MSAAPHDRAASPPSAALVWVQAIGLPNTAPGSRPRTARISQKDSRRNLLSAEKQRMVMSERRTTMTTTKNKSQKTTKQMPKTTSALANLYRRYGMLAEQLRAAFEAGRKAEQERLTSLLEQNLAEIRRQNRAARAR
jgi:hypothetical protein